MTFEDCIDVILFYEGGLVNHPNDPGKLTNFGISQRAYPHVNIENLTIEQAKSIYRIDYWNRIQAEHIPESCRLMVFDSAVNQGVGFAIKTMQKILGVKPDGVIGPITRDALKNVDEYSFINLFAMARHNHYTSLTGWHHFGKGWSKRLLEISVLSAFFVRNTSSS
jgi:lysozyme family protein